ncbi:MAG: AgmX/PglI C-terminal domain-containing protein [Deltaproteobacteria bacterium]|nr:AgmX/PglI C-terminal domain-containing protein [Deltaproteobacteria bacterium]
MATPQKPQHPGAKLNAPAPYTARPPVRTGAVAAPPPPPPKILRIGIIQGGRIVEERLVRERISVTVGQSAKNMFVVPSEALPRTLVMFEVTPQGYALNYTPQMDGRISLGDAVVPLNQLQQRSAPKPGGFFQLPLTDKSRGKVIAGDMTLLFQFVTPPPRQPRPQLPPSVRGGFGSQIDVMMATVLGISTALHAAFFVYLLVFVEIPKNIDIEEEFKQYQKAFAVKVKPPEIKKDQGIGDKKGDEGEKGKEVAKKPGKPAKALSAEEARARAKAAAEARIARAKGEASKVGILAVLTAKGGSGGSAFGDALAGGGAQSDIDRAMKNVGGVTTAGAGGGGGLASAGGGGGGGGRITNISDIGKAGTGTVSGGGGGTGVKTERKIKISGGRIDDVSSGDLDVSGANATLRRGYPAIKACYDRGLKRNPKLGGKLSVRITVTGAGGVGGVSVQDNTLGDPEVVSCMTATIRGWRFPQAQGGKSAAVEPTWVFKTAD